MLGNLEIISNPGNGYGETETSHWENISFLEAFCSHIAAGAGLGGHRRCFTFPTPRSGKANRLSYRGTIASPGASCRRRCFPVPAGDVHSTSRQGTSAGWRGICGIPCKFSLSSFTIPASRIIRPSSRSKRPGPPLRGQKQPCR